MSPVASAGQKEYMPDLQTLMTGLGLPESPRWHDGRLWFANWVEQELVAVDLEGRSEVIARLPSFPFSLDWLPDGTLLVIAGREGRLLRAQPDGTLVTHADLAGRSTHPWNELVVDGRGTTYLNNTGFAFPGGDFAPGTVAVVTPDADVREVADGIAFPNGMAVTPDNATLIVAESYAGRLTAFDIAADGSLSGRRAWAEIAGAAPDGICLDAEGGEVLETIELDRGCFACMLGGTDGRTLFLLTADWRGAAAMGGDARTGQILTTRAPAPGAGWP
jgi:sugar lactone lactonase YvrE